MVIIGSNYGKNNTLKYYDENADIYFKQTINGNMQEAYDKFLCLLPKSAYILDFGCGSGRDSKFFIDHGYKVKAIDGSKKLCNLAANYINQEVICMKFDELNDISLYDGIWACSSILHVERQNLPIILAKMLKAIKDDGVIYTSFKIGDKEIIEDGKYYNYITKDILENLLKEIIPKSEIIDYFDNITCANVDRPKTYWGNYLIKKKM